MQRTKNYFAGLVTGYFVQIATMAVGLWLTPFSLQFLDREEFAVFSLAGSLLNWLLLCEFGVNSSLFLQVAQMSSRPNQDRMNGLVSTAMMAQIVIVIAALALGTVGVLVFPTLYEIRPSLHVEAQQLAAVLLVGMLVSLGTRTFAVLLNAHQQIYVDNVISLLLVTLRAGLTVVLLKAGWGVLSLGIAHLSSVLITSVLLVIRARKLLPGLRIRRSLASWDDLRGIWSIGMWLSLGHLANLLILNLDGLVTARIFTAGMVSVLLITGRLYLLVASVVQQIASTAQSMIAQMVGAGREGDAFVVYRQLLLISSGVGMVAAISIWSGNAAFVAHWIKTSDSLYGGQWLDLALAMNLAVGAWVYPHRTLLQAAKIVKSQTICRLIEGGLNIGLSIFLAYRIGLVGIALSTSLASLAISSWYLPLLCVRRFSPAARYQLLFDAARLAVCAALLLGWASVLREFDTGLQGYPRALAPMAVSAITGAVLVWFVLFDRNLRKRTITTLQRITRKR